MNDIYGFVLIILVVQGFYGLGVTLLTHTLPSEMLGLVEASSDVVGQDVSDTVSDVQGNLDSQTNIPVIGQLGALIFYSGNILIDLILNFLLAIPQMFGIFFGLFSYLFGLDSVIALYVRNFLSAVMIIVYLMGLMQLFLNMRSGQRVS